MIMLRQEKQISTKKKSAGIETDLDKKAKDFEGLTPQQRYEKRVKDYYSKMKYER